MWVQPLGQEDPFEEGMTTHSSILAQKIPWMEEPGGLQSIGCKELDMTEVTEPTRTHPQLKERAETGVTHQKYSIPQPGADII